MKVARDRGPVRRDDGAARIELDQKIGTQAGLIVEPRAVAGKIKIARRIRRNAPNDDRGLCDVRCGQGLSGWAEFEQRRRAWPEAVGVVAVTMIAF